MTNTEVPTTDNAFLLAARDLAKASYEQAVAGLHDSTGQEYFDAKYYADFNMRSLIKRQFAYSALEVAVEHGFEALSYLLAEAISSPGQYSDPFAAAAQDARRAAALDLVGQWRSFLSAEALMHRL